MLINIFDRLAFLRLETSYERKSKKSDNYCKDTYEMFSYSNKDLMTNYIEITKIQFATGKLMMLHIK